jgi:tRNA (mo5U34)-methyltransferase
LSGHKPGRPTPLIEVLPDRQLEELNAILPWHSFVVDSSGRRFGAPGPHLNADQPQTFPNKRTKRMHNTFGLTDRTVLEVGCFEGLHTMGLCALGARVTAVDSRVENVVKTILRSALCGFHPRVFVCNVERRPVPIDLLASEYCHHVGVLYHLQDPVSHVLELGQFISRGILLDTHYALDQDANQEYEVEGERYRFRHYGEFGYNEVLSGMYDHAKWLTLPTILSLLARAGFVRVHTVEEHVGRQGPRVLILAEKG